MKVNILGTGSFGTFLCQLFSTTGIQVVIEPAPVAFLAIPIGAYDEACKSLMARDKNVHIVNVCSTQELSNAIVLSHTVNLTGWHPLFGARTPVEHRHSIFTHRSNTPVEDELVREFNRMTNQGLFKEWSYMTAEEHDQIMALTHKEALRAAELLRPIVRNAMHIPDHQIPHSFRTLRNLVKTLDDMPLGTRQSIMANKYT